MDYKKFFILLLVLANIFLVIGLLVNKEIIESKEGFQTSSSTAGTTTTAGTVTTVTDPNPYNLPPGRCLSQNEADATEDVDTETAYDGESSMSFACKFHILFIVNNPDGCANDADILTYYRTYFGETSQSQNSIYSDIGLTLPEKKFNIPNLLFGLYPLNIIDRILNAGYEVSDEILALQTRQASPFIIYKNKNSHTFLLHRASDNTLRLEVGSGIGGTLGLRSGGNVTSIDDAKEFLEKIRDLYLPEAPDTCPPLPTRRS